MIYQQTPDFYNEYISHSAVWEGRSRYRNGEDELEHGWVKDAAAKAHKYIRRWRNKAGKWIIIINTVQKINQNLLKAADQNVQT